MSEMSVKVVKYNGSYGVAVKPKNSKPGYLGPAGTITPCHDKKQAKKLASAIKDAYEKNANPADLQQIQADLVSGKKFSAVA